MSDFAGIKIVNNYLPLADEQRKEIIKNLKYLLRDFLNKIIEITINETNCMCGCEEERIVILTVKYSISLKIPYEIHSSDTIKCSYCPKCQDFRYLTPIKLAIQLLNHTF
ncbi:hypothetical protein A2V71_02835 [Candidatus Berkelbacteria bacterium RBG_13_40_8]|uniref:Uncharacterized protein n=1 Tax=Candidatus Berkelbacteria bacterium RBG_13_40_8 TaxID=1797467 RepID=A0A1F5DME6_9BACT|nr:MAG: hypothetical protein A2V71_02835 [Candidatus Berkelbacteria bacterium RBG_13_40_8]